MKTAQGTRPPGRRRSRSRRPLLRSRPGEKKEEPETPRPARKEKPKAKKKERRPRRRVPVGCVILVIFVALLAFGGFPGHAPL